MPNTAVGRAIPRVDAVEKVTGAAKYCSDLIVPGMLYARVLRSPIAHGTIRRIDTERAKAVPGVKLVLTGAEIRGIDPYYGPAFKDRPILAIDKVRYEGEPVAAVVGETEEAVLTALQLIDVEYDELPAVTDVESAIAPGAPVVHERVEPAGHFRDLAGLKLQPENNICHEFAYTRGRGEDGFEEADVVLEGTYEFPMAHHYAMEPHSAIAMWDGNELTIQSSTQNPYSVRSELAKMFKMPMGAIRLIVPYLGGGFGAKTYAKLEPLAAVLAREVQRPVRLAISVDEAFRTVRRCSAVAKVKIGARRDGTLVAMSTTVYYNIGAYADITPRVVQKGSYTAAGPYRIPHVAIQAYAVYTNTTPGGAFRGFGVPQISWAVESQLDEVAHRLGIDPAEMRMKNFLSKGDEYAPGDTPIEGDYRMGMAEIMQASGWSDGAAPGRGHGVSCILKASLAPSLSQAVVRLHADGSVTVSSSTVEMGQGSRTVLGQIAAEVLDLTPDRVRVTLPDTAATPYDQTSSSSRSTTVMGKAVQKAAEDVKEQLLALAAKMLGQSPDQLRIAGGFVEGADGKKVAYDEIVRDHFGMPGGELIGVGTVKAGFAPEAPLGGATPFWEVGMGVADVSIDEETGVLKLHRYFSLADIGKAINPQQAEGQDEGAAIHGLGHTLYENMIYENGQLLNGGLVDYRVPTVADVPEVFHSILIENEDGGGPFGCKGVGEGGLLPVAPAVANAIRAATGVRVTHLPATPEVLWRALRQREEARNGGQVNEGEAEVVTVRPRTA